MDVIIMPSITSLLTNLSRDYPMITFEEAEEFTWLPESRTIFYNPLRKYGSNLLLHELSHALLGHSAYQKDIELIAMETEAWEKAKELAPHYMVTINETVVQDHLDTYRHWLHARSTCPACSAVGYQTHPRTYRCIACGTTWRVNEARLCGLKRYVTKKHPA